MTCSGGLLQSSLDSATYLCDRMVVNNAAVTAELGTAATSLICQSTDD